MVKNVFCLRRLAITVEAIEFVDPQPEPGQEGAERGARIEIKLLEDQPRRGSVYASIDVLLGRALWRADLLERADRPGAQDRMHFHPVMVDNEPGARVFDEWLSADPIAWMADSLGSVPRILRDSSVPDVGAFDDDVAELQVHLPEVLAACAARLHEARGHSA